MKYIIDTQSFIWGLQFPEKLSEHAKQTIANNSGKVYLSAASVWEMAIKNNLGKLQLHKPLNQYIKDGCRDLQCKILPIQMNHILKVDDLPKPSNHKDPFDRMIIAQGIVTNYSIISIDEKFDNYPIKRIW